MASLWLFGSPGARSNLTLLALYNEMNCKRCHHTDEVHVPDEKSNLMIKLGECKIPDCTCNQFINPIEEIDEDLL